MVSTSTISATQPLAARWSAGLPFAALVLAGVAATTLLVGARFGLMLVLGLGFGLVLEGLRFGFAGQAEEQFGAYGAGLGIRARAVEIGGALLLVPAQKRIHDGPAAKAARRASTRARFTPKSLRPSRDAERT